MNTFLPYDDYYLSAISLDKKRCWKQVVETKQIINCLEGSTMGWKNHPAVKMWNGYLPALKEYFDIFLFVSKSKFNINTKMEPFGVDKNQETPWWMGNEDFHRAMRSRLIEKDETFYLPKFPSDKGFNESKYFWPDNETKTFRII